MKRILLVVFVLLAFAGFAMAQITQQSTDVLGAHLNYGRGGTAGNGKLATSGSGNTMLWGEDVGGLYGKTITTGGGKFVEVLPTSMSANTPDVSGMLTCLGCHDGNMAPAAMMRNKVYENLPTTYGNRNTIPTLMTDSGAGSYVSAHPMGLNATVNCGGASGWDCTEANGLISMRGLASSRFVTSYGYFVKPGVYNNKAVVVCTTCHEPHSMNVVTIGRNSNSGLPPGTYATTFFLRAPYNPNDTNPASNQTAQFCRQCHADKSNEMNGSTAGTVF
jgi:hypothetical protein